MEQLNNVQFTLLKEISEVTKLISELPQQLVMCTIEIFQWITRTGERILLCSLTLRLLEGLISPLESQLNIFKQSQEILISLFFGLIVTRKVKISVLKSQISAKKTFPNLRCRESLELSFLPLLRRIQKPHSLLLTRDLTIMRVCLWMQDK